MILFDFFDVLVCICDKGLDVRVVLEWGGMIILSVWFDFGEVVIVIVLLEKFIILIELIGKMDLLVCDVEVNWVVF